MVDKIINPPSQKDLIDKVNELIDDKQDTISDLATIRSGASAGSTALQPADVIEYTSNEVQTLWESL